MDIFEILVPLIFAAIYFFGNMFSKKEEDDASSPAPRPRKGEDPEAVERQRRIQDEIRRKIMERREAEQGEASGSPIPTPARHGESDADRQLRERRAAAEQRRQPEPAPGVSRDASASRGQGSDAAKRETVLDSGNSNPTFSWDQSDDIYDTEMKARLKKIEATKRQAKKLQNQAAAKRGHESQAKTASHRRKGTLFQGSVIENLRSPNAARTAFIYGEVLGPPVSRRKAETVPGLER